MTRACDRHERRYRSGARDEIGTVRLSTALGVILAGLLVPLEVAPSWAAWTNAGNVTGATVTSYTVPAVSFTGCTPGGNNTTRTVTLSFAGQSSPAVSYVESVSNSITGASVTYLGSPTNQIQVSYSPANPNRNKVVTVQVQRRLVSHPTWIGAADTAQFTTANNNGNATCNSW